MCIEDKKTLKLGKEAKMKHYICDREGDVQTWGRDALYFKIYDEMEPILSCVSEVEGRF